METLKSDKDRAVIKEYRRFALFNKSSVDPTPRPIQQSQNYGKKEINKIFIIPTRFVVCLSTLFFCLKKREWPLSSKEGDV